MSASRLFLSTAALSCIGFSASAQLLNPGFESSRDDGSIANWVATYSISIPIDSTSGECHADSMFQKTTDAHTGSSALVLQNVQCYENVIYGNISATDDIPAWGPTVPFTEQPAAFSFFYKFSPKGGDGIRARILLKDVDGVAVAEVDTVIFPGLMEDYTKMLILLNYSSDNAPERMYMYYSIVDNSGTAASVNVGTKLLIDDIAAESTLTVHKVDAAQMSDISFYPTQASNELFIARAKGQGNIAVEIFDMSGRKVKSESLSLAAGVPARLDISNLASGNFIVKAITKEGVTSSKFVH